MISLETVYDKFYFTVVLRYQADSIPFNAHYPSHEQLLNDDSAVNQMSGELLQQLVNKIQVRLDSSGLAVLSLTFKDELF
jgi:hypothetical protein